ncbi:hypothetical protein EW146_g9624 [Bondarzewia mesenterica]|uniref:Uncharacterized protein n=1 Tax=Bondarzewia mesenterica TaxID=1095465 RepID=A0A4S4L4P4_9AGAM|nr:hypothetical protein EW146_g9624 [Bondarzewia mesenterica]
MRTTYLLVPTRSLRPFSELEPSTIMSWSGRALLTLVSAFCTAIAAHCIVKVLRYALRPYFSPVRHVRGPESKSLLYGNLLDLFEYDDGDMHEQWRAEYGDVYKYKGFFNVRLSVPFPSKVISFGGGF